MRILEITYVWPAETFIVRHAQVLANLSADVHLTLASKSPATIKSASIQDHVGNTAFKVVSLPNFDFMSPLQKIRQSITTVLTTRAISGAAIRDRSLLQAVSDLQPDIVHFHFGALAAILAWCPQTLKLPYTVSLRGADIQVLTLEDPQYVANLCDALHGAAGVHTVCDAFAERVKQLCVDTPKLRTIRTCLPFPDAPLPPLESHGRPPHFVAIGRLHWRKAFHDLIRAMQYLPDATLDIIGDGPEREHLAYLIHELGLKGRVTLRGKMSPEGVQDALGAATAYVQSSVAEGFSNALAEAMVLGKAVFATDIDGTSEVVRDGENGLLLPVGEPTKFAEKLALAADTDLMRRLGAAARETGRAAFDEQTHAREFFDFYQNALRG